MRDRDELLSILQDIWERRASTSEAGNGYTVVLTNELCDRIRQVLGDDLADTDDQPDGTARSHAWPPDVVATWKESVHDYDPGPALCPHHQEPRSCWECNGIYDDPWDPDPDYDDSLPDWADHYPTWQSYMIHEYPEVFEVGEGR